MIPEKASVIAISGEFGKLVAIVYKDEKTRHNVFFKCEEMDFEEIESLLKAGRVQESNQK